MYKKIKVIFFISSLAGGGAERVMAEILNHIDKTGIEPVLVLLYPYEDSPYRDYLSKDIKVIVAERKHDSFFEKIKQFASFVKIVRSEKPHLILSMLTHNNIMAALAGIFLKIKVIACEHNTLGEVIKTKEGEKILGFQVAPLVRVLYRFADRVIAVSEGIRDNLIEEFKIDGHKINVIYNPLDMTRISKLISEPVEHLFFESNIPVIIAMGRLVWQKGFDTLIKAFANVAKETNAGLIILGEGPEKKPLQKLAMDMGIAGKVSFAGFQRNPYKFLSKADIFVLSSVYEGLPMVLLEALACGVPVISSDCRSGPGEILQGGRCGLLFPVGDVKALSDAILKLLKDDSLRDKFSKLTKERAKDFSVENSINQYENIIFRSLIK